MSRPDQNYSRLNRKSKRNKANTILNILIGVVIVLILITASTIFLNSNKPKQADNTEDQQSSINDEVDEQTNDDDVATDEETNDENNESDVDPSNSNDENEDNTNNNNSDPDKVDENNNAEDEDSKDSGVITYESTDEEIVERTIVDTSWQPIGTVQTGEHASVYEKDSVDWKEKEEALAYATGLQVNSMIFWKIKNGGSAQKSIGIVSNLDKTEMYRVYIEWVNERGWKPTKVDVLNTLDFDY